MFRSRTLFVIGAGASHEVGLPLGTQLRAVISRSLDFEYDAGHFSGNGDKAVLEALQWHAPSNLGDYLKACWRIRDGIILCHSIDNFLDSHRHDDLVRLCGKLGIVTAIANAERKSALFFDHSKAKAGKTINFEAIDDTYYVKLWRLLQDDVPAADVHRIFDDCVFVVFNYDRCLEHFFYHALQRQYDLPADQAAKIVSSAQILHPYGTIGRLPWQSCGVGHRAVGFGQGIVPHEFVERAEQIRTYTEQVESDAVQTIGSAVAEAEDIIFLGFSYFRENICLLRTNGEFKVRPGRAARIFGTAYALSSSDVSTIGRALLQLNPRIRDPEQITLGAELKCASLLEQYGRLLTTP